MEDDDDPCASSSMYELAGFVEVVMAGEKTQAFSEATNASSSSQGKLFENAKCRLSGEGTDVHILLETGALLYPLSDSCEQQADDAGALKDGGRRRIAAVAASQGESFHTPIFQGNIHAMVEDAGTESGGKKRRWSRKSRSMRSIVHDLYRLSTQNDVKVVGKITRVLKQWEKIRVVALLDIYLPSSLWSEHNYWKPGKVAASVLSHLSCDWEDRARKLNEQCRNFERDASEFSNVWQVGCCHVLGCKVHEIFSISEIRAKFNLYELFQCLPPIHKAHSPLGTAIHPSDKDPLQRGLYDLNDDILHMIFTKVSAKDLHSLTSTCHHTRRLCRDIIPNLTLKLFPHQRAAVAWMLQREQNALKFIDPVIKELQTKDGFLLYLNLVTGELTPDSPIEVMDFRGGLFCDEPGLGKTITALALILKTQGSFCQPPPGLQVTWFDNYFKEKLGYYELIESRTTSGRRSRASHKADDLRISSVEDLLYADNQLPEDSLGVSPCRCIDSPPHEKNAVLLSGDSLNLLANSAYDESFTVNTNLSGTKRKLFDPTGNYERELGHHDFFEMKNESRKKSPSYVSRSEEQDLLHAGIITENGTYVELSKSHIVKDLWLQCDACRKWRKWPGGQTAPDENIAWFCSMNKDPAYNSCSFPEEEWDKNERVFELPGFRKSGSACGGKSNVRFFLQVLKEHAHCLDYHTTGVLNWLANLSEDQLTKMAVEGIALPQSLRCSPHIDQICEAFGFVQHLHKTKAPRWFYPENLCKLVFDSKALKTALTHPVGRSTRVYLSNATLVVAPSNLVHHWRNQIRKHTKPGQLSVYVWNENKKAPPPHGLAWDYDIVITTFSRLSMEWSRKEESALMQVHWLRIILDEGHTLGASVCMTNKLQVAISMHSSYRWILTGTPMPNTPSTQLAHLHPMLKFLHENLYGQNWKWWESSVLRPFEAGCEDGRARLLRLLQRTMISSRKSDMQNIPPCIRKVKLLDFTAKHAASYNELVMTVRRNILLADWNDPDHVESLLNPKQYKSRSNTLRNVRLSCCVAGHIKMRDAGRDVKETLDIFVQQGVERYSFEYRVIESSLVYGSNCNRCSEWCRLPIVTSCKHFLCLSCVALDSAKCTSPDCGRAYKMQSPKARPENPNPKWPVPQDVIELQPSYAQEDWHVDWKETSSSKVAYLIKQLKLLQSANVQEPHLNNCAEKVIVYSQFLEHIYVIEEQFTAAGIQHTGLYTPLHSAKKIKSLMTFQNNLDCMVLIMDGSAALGLDLSFVTHVYLMEPIWDRSMEEQVVSRAHRMGATRAIYVETLAMRGTIEEQMLLSLETSTYAHVDEKVSCNPKASQRVTHDPTEGHYLAHLSFVRTQV